MSIRRDYDNGYYFIKDVIEGDSRCYLFVKGNGIKPVKEWGEEPDESEVQRWIEKHRTDWDAGASHGTR